MVVIYYKKTSMGLKRKNNILGIITARGGSKRVPHKNIKDFLGKPLLVWAIEVGKRADVFNRFILTTEDEEIAKIGRSYNIEVPFMRPKKLAQDGSSSYDVIKHAVGWLRDNDAYNPDWIILLEPSSPGRQPFHIKEVAEIISKNKNIESLVGISEVPAHFSHLKQQQRDKSGIITRVTDGAKIKSLIHRNQNVPKSYYINSAIYAFKTSNLFDGNNNLWGGNTYGYIMDNKYALDIDTPEDWLTAEIKMKRLLKEKHL